MADAVNAINGLPSRYFATLPTLTNGSGAPLMVDSRGRLILSPTSGSGVTYNATPPTLADGGTSTLQSDANGNLKVSLATLIAGEDLTNNILGTAQKPTAAAGYGYTLTRGFTATTYQNAKVTPGNLRSLIVTSVNAALRYLIFYNITGAPSGSTGVLASFPIPAGTATVPAYLTLGSNILDNFNFTTGVTLAVSTADGSFTAATPAEHSLHTWSA